MTDVVDQQTRSRMMSGIRGKNTKPELLVRQGLHRRGFRFRLHAKSMPGKPDIMLPKYKAIILIHGCFWHGHDCHLFKWPTTRPDFWREKIAGNSARDRKYRVEYQDQGWRVLTVWECALKGPHALGTSTVLDVAEMWLISDNVEATIRAQAKESVTGVAQE